MNKKYKANKEAILALRKKAKLTQLYFNKKNSEGFSYRNYQRAEAGEEMSKNVLVSIAKFYDKFLKSTNKSSKNITIEDIIIKDSSTKTDQTEKSNLKNFKEESAYLYRVENHNQLEQVIKLSNYRRKIFYMFDPDFNETGLIKNFLMDVTELKLPKGNKIVDTDFFGELETELNSLSKISNISSSLNKLKLNNIIVYAGNFSLPIIYMEPDDPSQLKYDDGFNDETGDYHSCVTLVNYAILSFSKADEKADEEVPPFLRSSSITFTYHNNWPKEKLERANKEFNFKMNGPFGLALQECD